MSPSITYAQLIPEADLPEILSGMPVRMVVVIEAQFSPIWQLKVSDWIVQSNCLYMMAWGENCSSWDDSVDWANLREFDFGEIPDDRFVMTTWHLEKQLGDVFWFAKHNAHHPTVQIEHTVLLHVSFENKREAFLRAYADAK